MITIEKLVLVFKNIRTKMERLFPYYARTERIQGMIDMIDIIESAILECVDELKEEEERGFHIW